MKLFNRYLFTLLLGWGTTATLAYAGDDPSIKGDLRTNIQASMTEFINQRSTDNEVLLYDAVDGQLLALRLDELHTGIVKKNGFYVSCADFTDQNDRKIDVDFLVRPIGDKLVATQALVHSIDGDKRKYHLEKM